MADVRRVLWIDDYINNRASSMFVDDETKKVETMDAALKEIAGEHLYEYDTIVLDIDFENGIENPEKVIEQLSKKIYLSRDQKDINFIINNGGYLLFLFLLEKGYPSEQVAFLTGNAGIIGQLKNYDRQNKAAMSKEEIVEKFIEVWQEAEEDLDEFEDMVCNLPIAKEYMDSDFVISCAEKLDENDIEGLKEMVVDVMPTLVTGSIQNTGDMMIFRFHEANLQSPIYFSKNDNDIVGHNRNDAQVWLQKNRTIERVSRWLVLSAGDYVEQLYRKDYDKMKQQVQDVLKLDNGDGGVRSAYRQMFFVFDGLRSKANWGVYYQAIAAMLIPFDATPRSGGDVAGLSGYDKDLSVRRMCAACAKQARNYSSHNYFGTTLTEKNTLFLLMIAVTALLTKNQRAQMNGWYKKVEETIYQKCDAGETSVDLDNKITGLISNLLANGEIDTIKANVDTNYATYTARNLLYALGYNKEMGRDRELNVGKRETYFVFTLATYIWKWFDGMSESDIKANYGDEVYRVYKISERLITEYEYV